MQLITVDPGRETGVAILRQPVTGEMYADGKWSAMKIDVMHLVSPTIHGVLAVIDSTYDSNIIVIEEQWIRRTSMTAMNSLMGSIWRWKIAAEYRKKPQPRLNFLRRDNRPVTWDDRVMLVHCRSWQAWIAKQMGEKKLDKKDYIKIACEIIDREVISTHCADAVCMMAYVISTNMEVQNEIRPK